MSTKRPTFSGFKEKALKDPAVKSKYDELSPVYEMKRKMIFMRKDQGKTQEEVAEMLGTKKTSISRLESLSSDVSPTLSTIEDYARVLGYTLKVDFEPQVR
ncbi:Uncharacterised protein [Halioglobus japonicus]|nr:Uncharacterised protein [Halioglobus japonicus]